MQYKDVVSFILLKQNSILLEKRKDSKSTESWKIVIPVWSVEDWENIELALIREVQEELWILNIKFSFLCTLLNNYKDYYAKIHYYVIESWEWEIECNEAESLHRHDIDTNNSLLEVDQAAINELKRIFNK